MRGRRRWAPCAGTSRMLKDAVLPGSMVWRGCGVFAGEMDMSAGSPSVAVASALPRRPRPGPKPVQRSGARRGRRRRPSRRHRYRSRLRRSTRHAARARPTPRPEPRPRYTTIQSYRYPYGAPLGLANKHLLALYPQTALELADTDRKTVTTFDAFPHFRDFRRML